MLTRDDGVHEDVMMARLWIALSAVKMLCSKIKIMNRFDVCEKQNNQSLYLFHHPTFQHCTIGQFKIKNNKITESS